MMQLVAVPILIGPQPDILGTLSVGFLLDDALAAQLKEITGSEVAFGMDGQILATTLRREDRPALGELLRAERPRQRHARQRGVRRAAAAAVLRHAGRRCRAAARWR